MASEVQTVIFAKNESPADVNDGDGWTQGAASGWLGEHKMRNDKVDETDNTFRFRQFDPSQCRLGTYKSLTENMPKGVIMTACDRIKQDSKDYKDEGGIERRFCQAECRVEPDSKKIAGYAAVFYDGTPETELDLWHATKERIMPVAFNRAVREDDVRALFNHDPDNILGRTTAGTLSLSVDQKGLRYEIESPDSELGRQVMGAIKRGDLTGSSFSFSVTDEKWTEESNLEIREILGVRIYDVGPVTFPAYQATTVMARSAEAAFREHRRHIAERQRERSLYLAGLL